MFQGLISKSIYELFIQNYANNGFTSLHPQLSENFKEYLQSKYPTMGENEAAIVNHPMYLDVMHAYINSPDTPNIIRKSFWDYFIYYHLVHSIQTNDKAAAKYVMECLLAGDINDKLDQALISAIENDSADLMVYFTNLGANPYSDEVESLINNLPKSAVCKNRFTNLSRYMEDTTIETDNVEYISRESGLEGFIYDNMSSTQMGSSIVAHVCKEAKVLDSQFFTNFDEARKYISKFKV
ncbi:MAG: hypothetical protein NE327_13140 [Lentisphaeraceae bacterium]|nr:hypothetical protein [Lentisphaeraceae bacterium]